jgi:hypothetical protein
LRRFDARIINLTRQFDGMAPMIQNRADGEQDKSFTDVKNLRQLAGCGSGARRGSCLRVRLRRF